MDEGAAVTSENCFFRGLSNGAVSEVMTLLADPESEHLSHAKTVKTSQVVRKKKKKKKTYLFL